MHVLAALALLTSLDAAASYRATAQVVAFSDDGTRALVEERTTALDGTGEVAYSLFDMKGRVLRLPISQVGLTGLQFRELIEREDCRAAAEQLETALKDFRSVRVHESACAMANRDRGVVRLLRTPPSPLDDVDELEEFTREHGVVGSVWASEDGPLVVVVKPNTTSALGDNFTIRTFSRADPRLHDRWEAPQ